MLINLQWIKFEFHAMLCVLTRSPSQTQCSRFLALSFQVANCLHQQGGECTFKFLTKCNKRTLSYLPCFLAYSLAYFLHIFLLTYFPAYFHAYFHACFSVTAYILAYSSAYFRAYFTYFLAYNSAYLLNLLQYLCDPVPVQGQPCQYLK
jgi:hypothetical protein